MPKFLEAHPKRGYGIYEIRLPDGRTASTRAKSEATARRQLRPALRGVAIIEKARAR